MIRFVFIFFGSLFLGIGFIGVFVPGLPTTIFVLLSAGMYAKSSPFLYNKLKNHKTLGPYLEIRSKGISLKTKILSMCIMWTMILLTVFTVFTAWYWRLLLIILGLIGTYFKLRLPTRTE